MDTVPEIYGTHHRYIVRECCEDNADVEDLVACEKDVEAPRPDTLRESLRAVVR